MPKLSLLWGYLVSLAASGVILYSIPIDDQKLGFYRVDALLQHETGLREWIAHRCPQLASRNSSVAERLFLERYTPASGNLATGRACQVNIESASRERFGLRKFWHFAVQILSENGGGVFERHYSVEAPRPLVLLPLAALLLALVFEIPYWGLFTTVVGFLFSLSSFNLIAGLQLAWQGARLTFASDQTLAGFFLIAAWLSLLLSHREPNPRVHAGSSRRGEWGTRIVNALLGLWNPGVYTISGQLLFPVRQSLARALPFLDLQLVLVGLSLYLFSLDMHQWREFLKTGILLPRYFTYTTLLFITISGWSRHTRRQQAFWQRPGMWRALVAIVVEEALSSQLPALRSWPTVTRLGAALLLSELVWPRHLDFKKAARTVGPWLAMIFLSSFMATLTLHSGAIDLLLVITEPRIHPIGLVFFTFVASVVLGFVCGTFSAAFFPLFTLLVKSSALPLVKAAMLDGVFAGILLSPFSLYNLLPAVQFQLGYQELLKFRFKQLFYPLAIGSIIYAVSAVNSVAILRPATFVFLCLTALAVQLRKSYWQIGTHTFTLEKAPR